MKSRVAQVQRLFGVASQRLQNPEYVRRVIVALGESEERAKGRARTNGVLGGGTGKSCQWVRFDRL